MYERWDRVREMEDPTGYLYRTAMNAFRSWHRRSALAAKRAIGLTRSDDSIEQLKEQDVVVRALAPLTARQRAAVVLIDLMGYSSDEAGHMLGVRPSTVRTHVERAHRDLKARLGLVPERPVRGDCPPTIDDIHYETVSLMLTQPVRSGPSGIWVVTGWTELAPDPEEPASDLRYHEWVDRQYEQVVPPTEAELVDALEAFLCARVAG